jgi:hypothetical protein
MARPPRPAVDLRVLGSAPTATEGRSGDDERQQAISVIRAPRSLLATALAFLFVICAAAPAQAGAADWTTTQLPGLAGELFLLNVSCPTASFCVATGTQNLIASSTDPTGGPGAWNSVYAGEGPFEGASDPVISNRQIQGVSCPSTRLCVAVTTLGQIYTSTDPSGPASAWSVTEISPKGRNTHLYGVSCPSESLCVAVSGRRVNTGKVFTSTDPGSGSWQEADLGEQFDLRAVSCASATLCVAAGADGELLASGDPTGGAGAWAVVGSPGGPGILQSISCIPAVCLTGNTGGNLLTASEPTSPSGWREAPGGASVQVTGSSCASPSACLAVDSNGDVIVSTGPTTPDPHWTATNLRPYTSEAETPGSEDANGLFGASCPTTSFCALVGSRGAVLTGSDPFAASPQHPGAAQGGSTGTRRRRPRRPRAEIARLHFHIPGLRRFTVPQRADLLIRFYAKGPVRRFECRLDHRSFRRCRSPERFRGIGRGIHRVAVRAVGPGGLRGPTASRPFYVGKRCVRDACVVGAGELSGGPSAPPPAHALLAPQAP